MSITTKLLFSVFLPNNVKILNSVKEETKEAGKQIKVDSLLNDISNDGFDIDKTHANELKGFIDGINNLMQLKLTGVHTVTLYNQRLELHFNKNKQLENIYIV